MRNDRFEWADCKARSNLDGQGVSLDDECGSREHPPGDT